MLIKEFLDANPNPIQPGYVFAVVPEKSKAIYQGYVKKAADSLGLRCESFLDFKHPGDALRDILARIQKAEILVYDISDFTPNVMWELGLGLAIKDAERVIVIREESDLSLPFNIYSHRVTFQYNPNSEESLNELYRMLREVMRRINRAGSRKAPIQSPEVKSLLDNALRAVERKEWITAEALFQTMRAREPDNWYIHNQWGIMCRSKGEFNAANEKLNQALTFTDSDDEKAFIYTEIAVLHQMSRKYTNAEEWFRKAEKADSENNRLYIAWAEYHDELGDYFSAQAKIGGALARIKRQDDDPNYKELMLRHGYYDKKIKSPTYRKTFEQFKREVEWPATLAAPPAGILEDTGNRLPYNTTWEAIVDEHVGAVVEGEIGSITDLGIFVRLSREFTGLIFWKNLMEGYGEKFSKNQKIKVRIAKAFINPKDQRGRIDLRLIDDQGEIIQPQPVLIGASAPQTVRPGDSFIVRFAAYLKRLEKAIKAQLTERSPGSEAYLAVREARWQIGTQVKVHLSSPHLIVLSPEEAFVWRGSSEVRDFPVQAPVVPSEMRTFLNFNISIGGISVAKFGLDLRISSDAAIEGPVPVTIEPATTAFASYASKDRLRVMDRLAEVRRSGLDVFVDCLDLQPGEKWKPRIEQEITGRDRFLLFWSAHAKESQSVTWEWKTALRKRGGLSGIDPHPLDDAMPPEELKELHFGDLYMQARKAFEESSQK
jgi:tetratricopeptide (TPR) repeat protein